MLNKYGLIMVLAQLVNAFAQIILKRSANFNKDSSLIKKIMNFRVIFAYSLFALVLVVNLVAYSGVEFKYGGIIHCLGQIFVVVLSIILLGEKLNVFQIVGNIVVLLGILVYNL